MFIACLCFCGLFYFPSVYLRLCVCYLVVRFHSFCSVSFVVGSFFLFVRVVSGVLFIRLFMYVYLYVSYSLSFLLVLFYVRLSVFVFFVLLFCVCSCLSCSFCVCVASLFLLLILLFYNVDSSRVVLFVGGVLFCNCG